MRTCDNCHNGDAHTPDALQNSRVVARGRTPTTRSPVSSAQELGSRARLHHQLYVLRGEHHAGSPNRASTAIHARHIVCAPRAGTCNFPALPRDDIWYRRDLTISACVLHGQQHLAITWRSHSSPPRNNNAPAENKEWRWTQLRQHMGPELRGTHIRLAQCLILTVIVLRRRGQLDVVCIPPIALTMTLRLVRT